MNAAPSLPDLERLARQAGEILRNGYVSRPGFGRELQVSYKGVIDLVTDVDHASEAFILGEIRQRFPSHQVMAEESGWQAGDACCVWYIDPLDGTVNFAHGIPLFAVSIAYAEAGLVMLGTVYDPLRDECFSAERKRGAWLNGEPLRASTVSDLDHSLLVTGFPYDIRTQVQNNLDHYAEFSLRSQGVRRLGSAALDLAYVAAGRIDGFWELSIKPWDIAAGGLIAEESGAKVTDAAGTKDYLQPPCSILATSPGIHATMLAMLANEPVNAG